MPVVAGQFYEGNAAALERQVDQCYLDPLGPGAAPRVNTDGPREIVGLVCPHAGYVFSGPTAAHAYSALADDGDPEVVVLIGLKHSALHGGSAVQTAGAWRTPLGDAQITGDVADAIADRLPDFATTPDAFAGEHSLEVQVPFLQDLYEEGLRFVPVMMADQDLFTAQAVADAVAGALQGVDAVIIASTDMTHYKAPDVAAQQDRMLIERIEAMDAEGLVRTRQERDISMCGVGPVAAMMLAAQTLGATSAQTLAYSTSGDVMPSDQVVGYLAAKVTH